jgi:hypothetical protein
MSTKAKADHELIETVRVDSAGGLRSEPGGRAQRPGGGARPPQGVPRVELPDEVRDRLADEVIDALLAGGRTEEEIVGPGGVLAQLTKRLVERAMSAELTEHLGYEPHREPPGPTSNTRNDSTAKTLATEHDPSGAASLALTQAVNGTPDPLRRRPPGRSALPQRGRARGQGLCEECFWPLVQGRRRKEVGRASREGFSLSLVETL